MDIVTQIVFGGAISYSIAGRELGRKSMLLGSVLGALPDLDVVIDFGNDLDNFIYHRSFSHSLFVLTAISLIVFVVARRALRHHRISKKRLWFSISMPLLTHPLLDSFTVYGTQLFWPLFYSVEGRSPESWSSLFIIDPLFTLPLVIGLFIACFKPIRILTVRYLLALSCMYIAWSVMAKTLIDLKIRPEIEEQFGEQSQYVSIATPFNTILWRVLVMSEFHYHVAYVSLLDYTREIKFETYNNGNDLRSVVDSASLGKLSWFTHGFFRLEELHGVVLASDLRMGVEGAYVFRFVVGKNTSKNSDGAAVKRAAKTDKQIPFRVEEELGFEKLNEVFSYF